MKEGNLLSAAILPWGSLHRRRRTEEDSCRCTTGPTAYLSRYLGYLLEGAHLLLVDVHRRPLDFSFADPIAAELQIEQPPCAPPLAVSYRVGEPAAMGGRLLAIWRRPLTPGEPLPSIPLPLDVEFAVSVDLEQTYSRAAADAYMD